MLSMNYILILLAGFFIAFLLARLIIPKIIIISLRKQLYDIPDGRKVHKRPISRLGGVSFFPAILFSLAFILSVSQISGNWVFDSMAVNFQEYLLFISGLTLLYIIGIADDLVGVRYRQKLMVQLIAAGMLPLSGLYINDLYGILWIHELPVYLGVPLTVLLVVFITNAINFIDGIDGLASGLSMVALSVYGCLFAFINQWACSLLAFTTIGVLLPFFFYNVFGNADRGKKIFMGDTGSLSLGFILSFLTVKYIMNRYDSGGFTSDGAILVAFGVLLVPCMDVVRVVLRRLRNGKSPFQPDKTHIHHKFLAMGFKVRRALCIILGMSFAFCIANILLVPYLDNTLLFFIDIVIWTGLNLWFNYLIKNRNVYKKIS